MAERLIDIEGIDPREFYGFADANLERLSNAFPKLRIIARGTVLRVLGEEKEIELFSDRIEAITEYYNKYGHLSPEIIERLISKVAQREQEEVLPEDILVYGTKGTVVRARTENQKLLVTESTENDLLIAVGPAGSGKTYTAIALAVRALKNKEIKRIILTRPAVEAGEKLGFLPGDMKEKLDPYLQPLYDALNDMIPATRLAKYMEDGTVQIAPLAYMRGRTLDNAFVILDEAQNTTLPQIKMFLTRMGRNAKFIVTGDITQIDLPRPSDSGLTKAIDLVGRIKGISVIRFDKGDIIRHPLVTRIVEAFEKDQNNDKQT